MTEALDPCLICGRSAEKIAANGCDVDAHLARARAISPRYSFDLEHPIDPSQLASALSICPRTPNGQIYPVVYHSQYA